MSLTTALSPAIAPRRERSSAPSAPARTSRAAAPRAHATPRAPKPDAHVGTSSSPSSAAAHPRGRRDALFAAAATLVATLDLSSRARPAMAAPAAPPPSCSSCEGAVDGTLGRCEGFAGAACRSTFDDRPPFFAAPWEFGRDVTSTSQALKELEKAVVANGGVVEVNDVGVGYLRASFGRATSGGKTPSRNDGAVALEFLARGDDDAVCEVRGSVRGVSRGIVRVRSIVPGSSEVEKLLLRVRRYLGWAEVPVLRNRTPKVLGYFETPFDDFGPVPPPTMDYAFMRADALSDDLQ
jgi:hypothetical protein